jgi:glycerol-3-phosphate acyltransferase PlsY
MLELGIKFTLAYWLGGVMGSLLIGRLYGGQDIRKTGSGNAGATNALRTHGKLFALQVLVVDVGKGILAVYLIPGLALPGVPIDAQLSRDLVVYAVGFAAVIGHVFPIWFGFRGGKGGATAAGLLCFFALGLALPILAVWVGIIALTGFVGLATMAASVAAAVYIGVTGLPEQHAFFVFASSVAVVIIYTHRGNIRRMLDGNEARIGRRFAAKR